MTALLTIILSFIGALVCGLMPPSAHRRIRWVALAVAVGGLVVSMACCVNYSGGAFADLIVADWIPSLGIGFVTGHDGISPHYKIIALADAVDHGLNKALGVRHDRYYCTIAVNESEYEGTVFTAATIEWAHGLYRDDSPVSQITRNVLNRLGV